MGERPAIPVATYSICACDLDAGQWGVATQSKFLAVGSVVPWAAPGVGASRRSPTPIPRYGPDGLASARAGRSADEVVEQLTAADDDREQRQLGVVDAAGRGATFTGTAATPGRAGESATATRRRETSSSRPRRSTRWPRRSQPRRRPLAERLLDCLAAAQAAGGDRRGQQSAALLVVERDGGYAGLSDVLVDLRVDDHRAPGRGAAAPVRLHHALFGKTPRDDWLPVDDALRDEIEERLARLGYATLDDWAGVENLEERVDGDRRIDPVVLDGLRDAS